MRFSIDNRLICGLVAMIALTGCSPLGLYNAVIPFDPGSRTVLEDVAYGPDPRQRLDIYAPVDASLEDRLPVIVFFYGGSWRSGERDRYAFAGRALAALGAVVVVADYRLVPGIRFPVFIEDNAAAVAWTVRGIMAHGGDPGRVYLSGHSAGAYNAALLALDTRYLRAAGVDPDVVAGVIGLSGPYDFDPGEYSVTRAAFRGSLDAPEALPQNFVTPEAPPMLLLHGESDTTVSPANTRALASAMSDAGVSVETRFYPDTGHAGTILALSAPLKDRAPILADIRAFLGQGF